MIQYLASHDEVEIFEQAYRARLPVLLKGPTGCGKSRFVDTMAKRVGRPLVQVSCNEDTTAHDLIGRFLLIGGETKWQDGPVTRAVRSGAILYLDEVAEAREDVVVVLHSLSDHRRELFLDKTNETLVAGPEFMLIASYNPQYQRRLKKLKPSTRQRFVTLSFDYPSEEHEISILVQETGVDSAMAKRLVHLAQQIRKLKELHLQETVSTRLLVYAASMIKGGLHPRLACDAAIAKVVCDEPEIERALQDLITLRF